MSKKQTKPRFGVGEWKMRNGEKAVIFAIHDDAPFPLVGHDVVGDGGNDFWMMGGRWSRYGSHDFDLIAPWPKSKPKAKKFAAKQAKPAKPSPHEARIEAMSLDGIAVRRSLMVRLPGISAKQKEFLKADIEAIEWNLSQLSAKEGK